MKFTEAIEGGITGTSTLALLQEVLHQIDPKAPRPLLHDTKAGKKMQKKKSKGKRTKRYARVGKELLLSSGYFGLTGLGNKESAVVKGALLGGAAGLWKAFGGESKKRKNKGLKDKLWTIALYTAAGVLAGEAVKKAPLKKNGKEEKSKAVTKVEETPEERAFNTSDMDKVLSTVLYVEGTPVGYEVHKEGDCVYFKPTEYRAKECCPPQFMVNHKEQQWSFEPNTIDQDIKDQVLHDLQGMKAGNFLN